MQSSLSSSGVLPLNVPWFFLVASFGHLYGPLLGDQADMARNGATGPVNVCVFCGSQTPEIPAPTCAHGRTARVQGDAARAAARLWLVLQSVESHRAELQSEIDREIKAGTALIDESPPVRSCGNVHFMGREIVVRDELRPVRIG